jgi:RNA polymerase sigma-70 factor (ECF subfamily)
VDLSADSCAALFERIRLGDAAAEGQLVESFGGRVYAMAVARTRDREASRDLVQDVLWAVIQALRGGHLRAPDKLAAFVSGTARNLINNYCRTRTRAARDLPAGPEASTADADAVLDERRRADAVRSVVRGFERIDRRILTLTLVDGLSAVEIAARVNLSPDAVRQRKSRAVKRVMAMLAERCRP